MDNSSRDAEYWQAIYDEGDLGWDKGVPAPPLVRAFSQSPLKPGGRVLVPGCGLGHEVFHLARLGFQVTAVDFASGAIAALNERIGELPIEALQRDLFRLDQDYKTYFDAVLEHTCFCAIPVDMRDAYARVMHSVLANEGRLVGLFYETDKEDGPPFRTTRSDIEQHFSCLFEIESIQQPSDSFENRQGKEWLVKMIKR